VHALAAHFTRVLGFLHQVAPMAVWGHLTRAAVEAWVDHRLASGRKPRTIASDVMLLRSLYAFLLEVEDVTHSPLQRPLGIRLPDMLPRFITDDSLARLTVQREAAVAHARTMHYQRQARLDRAAFYLLVDSGLRCGELVELRCEDVDLVGRRLCVRHAKLQRDRQVYLSPRTIQALRAYLAIREAAGTDHLLVQRGSSLTTHCVARRLQRWGYVLGIRLSPHRLRHTLCDPLAQCRDAGRLSAKNPRASLLGQDRALRSDRRSCRRGGLLPRPRGAGREGGGYRRRADGRVRASAAAPSRRPTALKPMPAEEREALLRQMRRLLEPPSPGEGDHEPSEPKKE